MTAEFSAARALVGILLFSASSALAEPSLLRAVEPSGRAEPPQEVPLVLRSRSVQVDPALLRSRNNRRMELALPDGRRMVIQRTTEEAAPGGIVWHGQVAGQERSQVLLSVVDDAVSGTLMTEEGQLYRLLPTGPGQHALQQLDPAAFPHDEPLMLANPLQGELGLEEQLRKKADGDSALRDSGAIIDVMVVYTVQARDANGGTAGIQSLINSAISQSNTTFANSGIYPRLRLVHTAEVNYAESGVITTDISRLRNPSDGFMDYIHVRRDTYKADLVSLLVKNGGGSCGYAYIMTSVSESFASNAFSVVDTDCATSNLSFAHEMGHNMGARHDWYVDWTNNSPFTYNHGYYNVAGRFRTVMAYNDACAAVNVQCTRIPYWSNPGATYYGYPLGAGDTNNAATLNNTAATVANFRPSM